MDGEISGIQKMYLLLLINPYTTYYNHQENNSLQQVRNMLLLKLHAAFVNHQLCVVLTATEV